MEGRYHTFYRRSLKNLNNIEISTFCPEVCNDEPPIAFSDIPYPDPYPNPNIDHDATNNQNVPQQDDTTEEEGLEQSQVKPPLRMPQDQSKSESDLEPEEEPVLIPDCNPDESYETILWKRIWPRRTSVNVNIELYRERNDNFLGFKTENEREKLEKVN